MKSAMAAHLPDVIDEEILCCHLCSRELQHPKVLPCLHVFCRLCLEEYFKRHQTPKHRGRNRPYCEDYITFPDTPFSDSKEDPFRNLVSSKRSSIESDDSTPHKRFQQPERYTDRDSLVQQAALYRNRYRRSLLKSAGGKTQNTAVRKDSSNKPLPPAKPNLSLSFHRGNETNEDKKQSGKALLRTVSSPQPTTQAKKGEDLEPMSGRVLNMVNIFEHRSASSSRENTPPLALFRTKAKSSSTQDFVPLSERPLPELGTDTVPQLHVPRSCSVDSVSSRRYHDSHSDHRSISLSTQDSYDSAFGTGESDKALVFVDGPTPSPCSAKRFHLSLSRVSSIGDDNIYEGYEIPENLSKISGTGNNVIVSDVYELAKTVDTIPRKPAICVSNTESSKRHKPVFRSKDSCRDNELCRVERPESVSENIYHEIQVGRKSRLNSMNFTGSVPDLLAEIKSKDPMDHDIPRTNQPRRNSTILDSYVLASDLGKDEALNRRIPLASDDSQRLSNLYMRMDGVAPLLSQTSYVAMNDMPSPGVGSPNVFPAESVQTIIRSLSKDFQSNRQITAASTIIREPKGSVPSLPVPDPPVYMNVQTKDKAALDEAHSDMDLPVHIYDNPHQQVQDSSHGYYNENDIKSVTSHHKTQNYPCPTCHRLFSLPDNQVAALRNCSFASQMQEVVLTQKCEKKQCGHCDNKVAVYRCLDCELNLCQGCHRGHSWTRSNKGHKVMTLQELQSGKFQREIKQLQVTECDGVECSSEAKHFCGNCDKVLCSDCLVRHSKFHLSCPIGQVATREADFIQSMAKSLQSRKEIFNGAIDSLTNYQSHCRDRRDSVLDDLKVHQEYVYLILDRCFDFIRSKVTKEFEAETCKAELLKSEARGSLSSMDHVTKFVKQLMEHGNPSNVVTMATTIKHEISRLQSMSPKVMDSQMQMNFDPGDVSIQRVQPLCGEVRTESTSLAAPDASRGRQGQEMMEHHTHQMELVNEFSSRLDSDSKGCRPNGITIAHNLIIIVDAINKKLKAFDFGGTFQWEICPKGVHALQDPWDVVVLSNDNLAVTDKGPNVVKIFTKGGSFVTSFGDHLRKPWGLTTNMRGEIIVTDTELRKVFIHDIHGRLLHTLPNLIPATDLQGSLTNFTLKCPEYVTTNQSGDVIVSDFENHRILVFDSLGRPLFKFGKKGKGMEEFHYPLGVATDTKGNIFVVNYQNQRITVISRNGQFRCCLTSKNALQSLQTIAISQERHLVVVDGGKVKIFRIPDNVLNGDVDITEGSSPQHGQIRLQRDGGRQPDNSDISKETTV